MIRSRASMSLVLSAALAASCMAPVDDSPPAPARSAAAVADARGEAKGAAPAAPAPAKFENGERAFAKAKEDLLRSYYREGLGEEEIYRAALAGMLEHLDPSMKG